MRDTVNDYIKSGEKLLSVFGCPIHYLIKPLTEQNWCVNGDTDMPILSYEASGTVQHSAIARQDGKPLIYRRNGYALVIAIDCIKIACLLDEQRELKT